MAIYRKTHIDPYLKELETYYWALRRALEGTKPNSNLAENYLANPEQFERDYREVDMEKVLYQVNHFKAAVDFTKNLKGKAQRQVHRR